MKTPSRIKVEKEHITSFSNAVVNSVNCIFPDKKQKELCTVSEIVFLLRGEQLQTPQLWHRDEHKEKDGLFMIYPLSQSYSIHVIPKSHTLEDEDSISSKHSKKLLLNPGYLFIGSSALVHAGGVVDPKSAYPRILSDGTKCHDIAMHGYITKGLYAEEDKSLVTVPVNVVDINMNVEERPVLEGVKALKKRKNNKSTGKGATNNNRARRSRSK